MITRLTYMLMLLMILLTKSSLCQATQNNQFKNFSNYSKYIEKYESGAFAATCSFNNKHEGVLIYALSKSFGQYFELDGDIIVDSAKVDVLNNAFYIETLQKNNQVLDNIPDRVIKTLTRLNFILVTPNEILSSIPLGSKNKCFEDVPYGLVGHSG